MAFMPTLTKIYMLIYFPADMTRHNFHSLDDTDTDILDYFL